MSYIFKDVDESLAKKASYTGTSKFIRIGIDPLAQHRLPFPPDHKFADCFQAKQYEKIAQRIRDFKVRKDDIWVVTFPKAGTTWVQNIVRQLVLEKMNFSLEPMSINDALFLEMHTTFTDPVNEAVKEIIETSAKMLDEIDATPSPRMIKSHLPVQLLPLEMWEVKPKIIYVARNPKDVAISFYHMYRNYAGAYKGTIEDFFELFLNDGVQYTPFHDHVLNYWEIRHLENVLFLTYEDLSADRFAGVKRISDFLGCTYSDEKLLELTAYVSFEHIRKATTKELIGCSNQDIDFKLVLCLIHFLFLFFTFFVFIGSFAKEKRPHFVTKWAKSSSSDLINGRPSIWGDLILNIMLEILEIF